MQIPPPPPPPLEQFDMNNIDIISTLNDEAIHLFIDGQLDHAQQLLEQGLEMCIRQQRMQDSYGPEFYRHKDAMIRNHFRYGGTYTPIYQLQLLSPSTIELRRSQALSQMCMTTTPHVLIEFFGQAISIEDTLREVPYFFQHDIVTAIVLYNFALFYNIVGCESGSTLALNTAMEFYSVSYSIISRPDVSAIFHYKSPLKPSFGKGDSHNLHCNLTVLVMALVNNMAFLHENFGEHRGRNQYIEQLTTMLDYTAIAPCYEDEFLFFYMHCKIVQTLHNGASAA